MVKDAFFKTIGRLEGAFALCFMFKDDEEKLNESVRSTRRQPLGSLDIGNDFFDEFEKDRPATTVASVRDKSRLLEVKQPVLTSSQKEKD